MMISMVVGMKIEEKKKMKNKKEFCFKKNQK
jgi:hypothetical protein